MWTDANIELLKRRWAEGVSCSAIAKELGQGITRNAVIGKIHRMHLGGSNAVRMPKAKPEKAKRVQRTYVRVIREATGKTKVYPRQEATLALDAAALRGNAWDALPGSSPVALTGLERGQCKWPIGDDLPFTFCGCEALPAKPYCAVHSRRAAGASVGAAA